MKYKIKDLKKLLHREWDKKSEYDSVLLINSKFKHKSGWAKIYIIGIRKEVPIEIAGMPDDIEWEMKDKSILRTDMYYGSGIIRFWSRGSKFIVGASLSSVTIEVY